MNTHDHDNDALPGEDELKSLYRSLPRKEPSPAMDSAIRRAAADAVRAGQRRHITRWPVAVASAAVMVVAVGLGWRMMQQPASVPPQTVSRAVIVSAAPASAPAPATPSQGSEAIANAPAPTLAAAPASRIAMPAAAKRENIRSAMKPKVVAPTIATEQPPAAATEPAPMVAMNEDRIAAPPAPAPAAPAPVADAASSAYAPQAAMRTTAVAGALNQRAVTAMKITAAPVAAPDSTAVSATDTPAQELEKIRQLFALHRHDEAMQRLTTFRQTHPDVPLPDDLRAQLPDHE